MICWIMSQGMGKEIWYCEVSLINVLYNILTVSQFQSTSFLLAFRSKRQCSYNYLHQETSRVIMWTKGMGKLCKMADQFHIKSETSSSYRMIKKIRKSALLLHLCNKVASFWPCLLNKNHLMVNIKEKPNMK